MSNEEIQQKLLELARKQNKGLWTMIAEVLGGNNIISAGIMFLVTFAIIYKYKQRGGRNRV